MSKTKEWIYDEYGEDVDLEELSMQKGVENGRE